MLRPNRTAHAWWICLPLLAVLAVELGLRAALDSSLPSGFLDVFCQVARALGFGVAAIWLASPFLVGASRFRTFLKMLLGQAGFSLLAYAGGQDWSYIGGEAVAALIYLGVFVLVLIAALGLAGRSCRHRFQPLRLSLCLLGWLTVCFVAILLPFAVFAFIAAGERMWAPLGIATLVSVAVQFTVLFPFLVLSFTNNFYRERLRQLLRPETPEVPPVLTPVPIPIPAT